MVTGVCGPSPHLAAQPFNQNRENKGARAAGQPGPHILTAENQEETTGVIAAWKAGSTFILQVSQVIIC